MSIETTTAEALVRDLVSIPSVSGAEEPAAERLVEFFEANDREAWIDGVGNVRAPANDDVLLTSHIDTVPGEIPVRVDDGVLWGRGSVDAKGPLSAMAVAAVSTGVSFAGVVGEEQDSRGARHLVNDREPPAALVNGEPSGWDGITLGYRGFLAGTYTGRSDSGHSSRPGNNAIEEAMDWRSRVSTQFEAADSSPVFEQVTVKPVRFVGGLSTDGLAIEADLDIQFRVPPSTGLQTVRETAEQALSTGELEWTDEIPPSMQSPRTPVARALRAGIRTAGGDPRQLRKTGTADVNIYDAAWDCPMATYGPGDSALDHTPNEHLSLEEFNQSITVLEYACRQLTS